MKLFNFFAVACFVPLWSSSSFAVEKTTLTFELTGETIHNNKTRAVNVKKLNKKLKAANLEGLPESITVDATDKPYWKVLMKRIEAANKISKIEMSFAIDKGYMYEFPEICFNGDAEKVYAVIEGLLGTFFHDEQGFLAVRFSDKKKIIADDLFGSEKLVKENYGEDYPKTAKLWTDFDTNSDSVLVMSNLGPQGDSTELYATFIKPCK